MKTYIAKWPDGTYSVVLAKNDDDAAFKLDREGNVRELDIITLNSKQSHVNLNRFNPSYGPKRTADDTDADNDMNLTTEDSIIWRRLSI